MKFLTSRSARITAGLVLLSIVPALAGTMRLAELAKGAVITPANARFFAMPIPVVIHILCVIPFSIVGAFQFAPAFRRNHRHWHRAAGAVLMVCGLFVALSGLWMTLFYPWAPGDGVAVYLERLIFGSAMVFAILRGADAIRTRNFDAHGAWMIRAYAIGMGAGTQVLTHLPWFILVGKPGVGMRGVLMGAGWIINIIVAEWIIARSARRNRVRPVARPRRHASLVGGVV